MAENKKFNIENLTYPQLRVLAGFFEYALTPYQIYYMDLLRRYIGYREKCMSKELREILMEDRLNYPISIPEFPLIKNKEQLRLRLSKKLKVSIASLGEVRKECRELERMGWLVKKEKRYRICSKHYRLFVKQFNALTKVKVRKMKSRRC